jgi:response regulator RpfG family c-di-GMP phosphodiesterase
MKPKRFIIIDDDPFSNKICSMLIKSVFGEMDIQTFTIPETGFEYVQEEYASEDHAHKTVMLLDINMPTMSGWEFLEQYENLDKKIKEQLRIFILSSSVDQQDIYKAQEHRYVVDFISKPISRDVLLQSVSKISQDVSV